MEVVPYQPVGTPTSNQSNHSLLFLATNYLTMEQPTLKILNHETALLDDNQPNEV